MPPVNNAISLDIAQKIALKFGYQPISILPVQKGYRNESHPVKLSDGTIVNVILFKDELDVLQTISNADAVSIHLFRHGFPARQLLEPRKIAVSKLNVMKYAAIYSYLPGETIPWEAYTQKHLKQLGKTLSDMHLVLREFDARHLPDVSEIYLQIVKRMRHYFAQFGVVHAMSAKLGIQMDDSQFTAFDRLLGETKLLQNKQALHMDFVRGNILFTQIENGPEITGILDFEKTARGNPAFDIARTYAFLLVDCKYKSADKVRKYFLHSGYQKHGNAQLPSVRVIYSNGTTYLFDALTDLFLIYDFYKFLRHNPYEFLHQNEHYVRTRDLLTQRNLIVVENKSER